MKTNYLFPKFLVAGLMLLNISIYQVYGQAIVNTPPKQHDIQYSCPMHPEVTQSTAGNCPKCGMQLIDKKDMPKEDSPSIDSLKLKKNLKMLPDSTKVEG
jgi:hypothetical protein